MSAEIVLDLSSPVPPFEQLRARITALVDDGSLTPGSRLPSVRALAADLGIAVGTVARAYRELEAAGYVVSRRRHGTTVAEAPPRQGPGSTPGKQAGQERDWPADVVQAAEDLARRAAAAGFSPEETVELLTGVARRMHG
ncbi:GntR family transcriptional regulator [Citricoccus muralis]|uniref:DNA-binding transcriptional regulator YhcF (GntR family) n=1 Tax=Citricoccus muralis TaxID=169134 RepID=A0A3D9LEP4_9MICC|nr:GntR family transcriptional regulator [Citricoccus muralis]REE03907.1 DNA-binding transcriptional regulator YhcF (GntR family) [Citricoccus muralis]